jgi:hypothetical protein
MKTEASWACSGKNTREIPAPCRPANAEVLASPWSSFFTLHPPSALIEPVNVRHRFID